MVHVTYTTIASRKWFYFFWYTAQVHDWRAVVALAKRSDVIFNGIDVGPLFDAAVNGLSLELGIPLVRCFATVFVLNF